MGVLHRNRTVVKVLLSHMLCSVLEVRCNPDARIRSSRGSTGVVSLNKDGSLIVSTPVSSVGKRRVGTRSLVIVGSGTISVMYVL